MNRIIYDLNLDACIIKCPDNQVYQTYIDASGNKVGKCQMTESKISRKKPVTYPRMRHSVLPPTQYENDTYYHTYCLIKLN